MVDFSHLLLRQIGADIYCCAVITDKSKNTNKMSGLSYHLLKTIWKQYIDNSTDPVIQRNFLGKLSTQDDRYVSLSYSDGMIVGCISCTPIGLDVECNQIPLRHKKFIEYNVKLVNNNLSLRQLFTLKESAYKLIPSKKLFYAIKIEQLNSTAMIIDSKKEVNAYTHENNRLASSIVVEHNKLDYQSFAKFIDDIGCALYRTDI